MSDHPIERLPVFTKAEEGEVLEVNEQERTIKAKITTDRVDSDQEVVITSGLKFGRFEKNPVVLFMHDMWAVVGKSLWQQVTKRAVIAKTRFAETDMAEDVFQLYAGGFLKGWSLGMDWRTIVRRELKTADLKKRPDWAGARSLITSADVIEYSACSIPANPDALNKAYGEGRFKTVRPWIELDNGAGEEQNEERRVTPIRKVCPVRSVKRRVLSVGEVSRVVDREVRLACGRP